MPANVIWNTTGEAGAIDRRDRARLRFHYLRVVVSGKRDRRIASRFERGDDVSVATDTASWLITHDLLPTSPSPLPRWVQNNEP